MITRPILLASAASVAIFASPAFAADSPASIPAAAAAGTVAAAEQTQQETDDVSRGDVIIVTARRRQETAQAVPLAISVIKGDSIEATGNFNIVKLQQLAPTHIGFEQRRLAGIVHTVHRKHALGEIDTNVQNGHDFPFSSELMRLRTSHRGTRCRLPFAASRLARDGEVPCIR